VAKALSDLISIQLSPERLEEGSPEERAAFGLLTISVEGRSLTEGYDDWIKGYRQGPLVSAYFLAEWLVWNWWRLGWEPTSRASTWWRAHKVVSIGEGYVWPNITITSDGRRTTLNSLPSRRPDARPFRFLSSEHAEIPSARFEDAVDAFIPQVLERLRTGSILKSNLGDLWEDLAAERSDSSLSKRRKFEAMLGQDPDELEDCLVDQIVDDAQILGAEALGEVLADSGSVSEATSAKGFREEGRRVGFALSAVGISLGKPAGLGSGESPAWQVGVEAAGELRSHLGLASGPISDDRLADLAGLSKGALAEGEASSNLGFIIEEKGAARVALRSRTNAGRRFEFARLVGDRLMASREDRLFPATQTHTFRQKAQRAFAAELLAPFAAVNEFLDGDYSDDARSQAAREYKVSELAIATMLVNNGKLNRDWLLETA